MNDYYSFKRYIKIWIITIILDELIFQFDFYYGKYW